MKGRQKGQNKFNNYVAVLCVWITFLVGSYQKEVGGCRFWLKMKLNFWLHPCEKLSCSECY